MDQALNIRRILIKGFLGVSAISIASKVFGLLISITLAQTLGAEGLGLYGFAMAVMSILVVPVQLGLPQMIVRQTAVYLDNKRFSSFKGLIHYSSWTVFVFSMVVAVSTSLYAFFFIEKRGALDPYILLFASFLIPFLGLNAVRDAVMRGMEKVVLAQLTENIFRPVLFLSFLAVAFLLLDQDMTALGAIWLQILATLFSCLVGYYLFCRIRPNELTVSGYDTEVAGWSRKALPFLFLSVVYVVNERIGTIMLGTMTGAEEVGIYRVILQAGVIVAFGLTVIEIVIAPHIARMHDSDDMKGMQKLLTRSAQYSLTIAIPVVILLVVFGDWILESLFGNEFVTGHKPLVVLAIGHLFNAAMGCLVVALNMTGNGWYTTFGITVSALSAVLFNWILIPQYEVMGAAIATAISIMIWNVLLFVSLYRETGLVSLPVNLSGIFGSSSN